MRMKQQRQQLQYPLELIKWVQRNKHKYGLRRLATMAAEKFPELGLCSGNQIEGMELVAAAEGRK